MLASSSTTRINSPGMPVIVQGKADSFSFFSGTITPLAPPSSSGPGRGPFKAKTGVRIPVGAQPPPQWSNAVPRIEIAGTLCRRFLFHPLSAVLGVLLFDQHQLVLQGLPIHPKNCHARSIGPEQSHLHLV